MSLLVIKVFLGFVAAMTCVLATRRVLKRKTGSAGAVQS